MSTTQTFRIAQAIARQQKRRQEARLAEMYAAHIDWAKRSGFDPMTQRDFRKSRLRNPPSATYIRAA